MPIFNHFLVTYGALVSTWMNGRYNPNTFNLIATTHSTVAYGILCEQGRSSETVQLSSRLLPIHKSFSVVICANLCNVCFTIKHN